MRRRLAAAALLAVAGGAIGAVVAGIRGDHEPIRRVAPVTLPTPPAAEALAKAAAQARALGGRLGALLDRAAATDHFDARIPALRRGDVTLRDVIVHKDGARAFAEASVSESALQEYLPSGVTAHYDPSAGGEGIVFRGSATVLGVAVPVTARALARDGAVVVVAENLPLPDTALFADPRVHVDRLSAQPIPGGLRARVEGTFT